MKNTFIKLYVWCYVQMFILWHTVLHNRIVSDVYIEREKRYCRIMLSLHFETMKYYGRMLLLNIKQSFRRLTK